jgi:hypothetical protein
MPLQASGDTYPPLQRVHSPVMHRIMTYSKAATYNTDIQLPRWYELHAARGLRATGPVEPHVTPQRSPALTHARNGIEQTAER